MDRKIYAIITFANSNFVLKGEDSLECLDIKVIPIPVEISSGCGLCIMLDIFLVHKALKILENDKVNYEKIYKITKTGFSKILEEIK